VTVLDTEAHGDLYRGPVKGVEAVPGHFETGDARRYRRIDDGTRVEASSGPCSVLAAAGTRFG